MARGHKWSMTMSEIGILLSDVAVNGHDSTDPEVQAVVAKIKANVKLVPMGNNEVWVDSNGMRVVRG